MILPHDFLLTYPMQAITGEFEVHKISMFQDSIFVSVDYHKQLKLCFGNSAISKI